MGNLTTARPNQRSTFERSVSTLKSDSDLLGIRKQKSWLECKRIRKAEHIMKKEVQATISYWRDPGVGSSPDPNYDADIILGHHDEENRTMLFRDIRGTESSYS